MNNLANALLMQERHREARQMIEQALRIENKQEYLDTLRTIEEAGKCGSTVAFNHFDPSAEALLPFDA